VGRICGAGLLKTTQGPVRHQVCRIFNFYDILAPPHERYHYRPQQTLIVSVLHCRDLWYVVTFNEFGCSRLVYSEELIHKKIYLLQNHPA